MTRLTAAIARVNAAKSLGSEATTLQSYLQADITPLQQPGEKIASDTTAASIRADGKTIFTNYRVLALVLPAARLAGSITVIQDQVLPRLEATSAKASSRETAANQASGSRSSAT